MNRSGSRILKGVRLAALAALGATVLGITPVWAGPINWTFDVTSTFDVGNTHFSRNTNCKKHGTTFHNYKSATTLSWGCPVDSNQSSLTIDPSAGHGTVSTDGAIADLVVGLTHDNYVINQGHLTKTNLINAITLTPDGGSAESPFNLTFGINFTETSNSGHCAVAPDPGFGKCPDIFVLDNDSLNNQFDYDNYTYFVSIFPASGVDALDRAACHAAHVMQDSCSGFVTQENSSNALKFNMEITSKPISNGGGGGPGIPVPEPSALGLMGLGLLSIVALAALRRRRSTEDTLD